jgi:hypothetical protein
MNEAIEPDSRIALTRRVHYAEVATVLLSLGLHQAATISWTPGPFPDRAEWRGEAVTVRYVTDFDCGLKSLELTGLAPPGLTDRLPCMTSSEAIGLMQSADRLDILAGIQAAGMIGDQALEDAVSQHLFDDDVAICDAAALAIGDIFSAQSSGGHQATTSD